MGSIFQLFPEQASTMAPRVDALYFYLIGIGAFFSLLIFTLVIYFAIKYRRRSEDEPPPPEIPEILALEVTWIVIPLVLALIAFFWGANVYYAMARPPQDALEVFVVGRQWMWKFQHPDGQREINQLHVPLGRPVKLTLASEDVIHSFFIPAFRVKYDVVPGRYTTVWFEATKPGKFHLFCAEYCGTQHSGMIGQIVVLEPKQYQAWLSGALAGPRAITAPERPTDAPE
ncbi:MAG: cytochrome c oxidase subunit II, partial [Candidatus Binatia bacterium]